MGHGGERRTNDRVCVVERETWSLNGEVNAVEN